MKSQRFLGNLTVPVYLRVFQNGDADLLTHRQYLEAPKDSDLAHYILIDLSLCTP